MSNVILAFVGVLLVCWKLPTIPGDLQVLKLVIGLFMLLGACFAGGKVKV